MAPSINANDLPRPRKPVAARFASPEARGESDRKKFADRDSDEEIGRLFARAIVLANLTPQEVAFHLGYSDQSAVSRWLSGAEPLRLARVWALKALRAGLVLAMAEASEHDVEVRTVVTVSRRKAGAA